MTRTEAAYAIRAAIDSGADVSIWNETGLRVLFKSEIADELISMVDCLPCCNLAIRREDRELEWHKVRAT